MDIAIRRGNLTEVQAFLNSGIDVNHRFEQGDTPLMLASRGNRLDIVQLLIKNGADVHAKNDWDRTALHEAVENSFQITRLLVEQGADINALTFENYSPLHLVARENNIGMSKFLIEHGANVNNQAMINIMESGGELHHMGPTILCDVVKNGKSGKAMIELLLKHGADPLIPDFYGKTAVDVAIDEIKQLFESKQTLTKSAKNNK